MADEQDIPISDIRNYFEPPLTLAELRALDAEGRAEVMALTREAIQEERAS